MKIVEYTSTKLTIQQNRPVRHWIIGMIFMIVGLIAILGPEQLTTLTCDRVTPNQGSCQLVHSSLLFSDEITIPLENLQEAKIQVNPSYGNDSSRIVLVTKNEQIPLTKELDSDFNQQYTKKIDRINNFIHESNQKYLKIEQDNRLFRYIFGGLFLLVGFVGSGVITQEFTCQFDKTVGSLTLIKKGFLWTRRVKKPISDIIGLQVDKPQNKKQTNNYRINLVLMSGKVIGLASAHESNRVEIKRLINCITTFLNIGITNHW